jgi:membrane protease subunit (stomatin/prohibitin family)
MSLASFIKKQFIDVLEWSEDGEGVLVWRHPMEDAEIQFGATLIVRESQLAVFINEGKIADVFKAGTHKLVTKNLPLLTNLQNWDKSFESPFKSDVYFFSTRNQLGRKWGTAQPITIRDKDFGMIRIRAFGLYSYRISDAARFFKEVSGTRDIYRRDEVEEQVRNLIVASMSAVFGASELPFLDMAGNQTVLGERIQQQMAPEFERYGLSLERFAVQNVSLPEELQKGMDTRISMGMAGDMTTFTRYQVANALPLAAQNEGGVAGLGASLAAGMAMGQSMAGELKAAQSGASPAGTVDDPVAGLEKLKALLDKGLIVQTDYDHAKAEILRKITG